MARAELLATIRAFFSDRGVLEVSTPQLCTAGVTDPAIEPLLVSGGQSVNQPRFLQTSPEYALKRLLAAGSGPIYEISRAFRDGEAGPRHNPEFTLLEWYRPGFDHHELMAELAALLEACLGPGDCQRISYRELFLQELAIDPFLATEEELVQLAGQHIDTGSLEGDRDLWLDLIMSHLIEPRLAELGRVFVFDYPASQAALSRSRPHCFGFRTSCAVRRLVLC